MYAGVVHEPFDIRYEQIETPKIAADEVLVKVKYTGICGSDIPRVNGNACHFFPNVLGHEFSGTIVAVGENVTDRKVSDRVAGVPLVPCMKCADCQKGDYSLCKHYSFIGSRRFGSFAEYVAMPAQNTVVLDDAVTFEQGALFEPATVALHGLRCAKYEPGKVVAIIGAGTIGALTMQWCKIFGASKIVMLDCSSEKLEYAKNLGADGCVLTTGEDWYQQAMALSGGRGFDFVFESAGSSVTIKMAYRIAASHAHVCIIGTPKNDVTFSVSEWENLNRKEMYVTGSWMSYSAPFPGSEWTETAHFFSTGALKLDSSMIWKILPLSRIDEAFAMFNTPGAVKGKILIDSEA
ncbi:MAG: galactitol-1-phosphate 5-dehydrogenase [Ruminococcaceae bacterium]|nr:galactitol-1-phosphate 5-dehydrogenase [Oscillospiraceae bacterium]